MNGSAGGRLLHSGKSPLEEGERDGTDEDIQIVEDHRGSASGWGARTRGADRDRRRRSR